MGDKIIMQGRLFFPPLSLSEMFFDNVRCSFFHGNSLLPSKTETANDNLFLMVLSIAVNSPADP